MVVAIKQSLMKYDLQAKSYNIMVLYNTTDVSLLCHTWKACICLGVCILILHPFFLRSVFLGS